jgi:hypothetical protein
LRSRYESFEHSSVRKSGSPFVECSVRTLAESSIDLGESGGLFDEIANTANTGRFLIAVINLDFMRHSRLTGDESNAVDSAAKVTKQFAGSRCKWTFRPAEIAAYP